MCSLSSASMTLQTTEVKTDRAVVAWFQFTSPFEDGCYVCHFPFLRDYSFSNRQLKDLCDWISHLPYGSK